MTKAIPQDEHTKPKNVMVTFGRGCAELQRQFDEFASAEGNYTRAGFAMLLIREGIERRLAAKRNKPR